MSEAISWSYGGGLYASKSFVTNCLFAGNRAYACGGGLYLAGTANATTSANDVRGTCSACTFTNNEVTACCNGGGAAVHVESFAWLDNLNVIDNRATGRKNSQIFGSAIYYDCANLKTVQHHAPAGIVNCLFVDNEGVPANYSQMGVFCVSGSFFDDFIVSNCVFSGNTTPMTASHRTGVHARLMRGPISVVDCLFENEIGGFAFENNNTPAVVTGNSVVRQCLFKNLSGYDIDLATAQTIANTDASLSPTVTFESCTFADCSTTQRSGGYAVSVFGCYFKTDYATRIYAKNCLLWNNHGATGYDDFAYWFAGSEGNFSYTLYSGNNTVIPAASGHNGAISANPFITDSHALKPKTVARDALPVADAPDWMKAAQAKDLGDGTYTVEKVQDYGVHIAFNKRHKRLIGEKFDIGASESKPKTGFLMYAR